MSATRYNRPHVDIFICIEMTRERKKHPVSFLGASYAYIYGHQVAYISGISVSSSLVKACLFKIHSHECFLFIQNFQNLFSPSSLT